MIEAKSVLSEVFMDCDFRFSFLKKDPSYLLKLKEIIDFLEGSGVKSKYIKNLVRAFPSVLFYSIDDLKNSLNLKKGVYKSNWCLEDEVVSFRRFFKLYEEKPELVMSSKSMCKNLNIASGFVGKIIQKAGCYGILYIKVPSAGTYLAILFAEEISKEILTSIRNLYQDSENKKVWIDTKDILKEISKKSDVKITYSPQNSKLIAGLIELSIPKFFYEKDVFRGKIHYRFKDDFLKGLYDFLERENKETYELLSKLLG
ncbi:MAG: hypothetical protein N3D78_02605 [Candidatus Aenigmarchaeota archaeon]|nr:hypothetical protein [Candidatus Aenigmarchaeota archaeon]